MIIGIDEAGRGSVMGPMVICAFCCEEGQMDKLEELELTDSKLLSANKREILNEKLKDFSFKSYIIEPEEIDNNSLGKLFKDVIFNAIGSQRPDKIIIDSPVPANNLTMYRDKIKGGSPIDLEVVCENEADVKYPIVSAASIVAKVKRDDEIKKINKKYRQDFSGYPDPKTKGFLKDFYRKHRVFPPETRMKWKTVEKIIQDVDQQKMFEV